MSCCGFPHASGDLCLRPQGDEKQNKTTNWELFVCEQELSGDDQYQYLFVFLLGLVRLIPALRVNAWPPGILEQSSEESRVLCLVSSRVHTHLLKLCL